MKQLKKFFDDLVRTGAWIIAPIILIAGLSPTISGVKAADNQGLVFAYQSATVSQTVNIPNIATASTLTATVRAAEVQDIQDVSDKLLVRH